MIWNINRTEEEREEKKERKKKHQLLRKKLYGQDPTEYLKEDIANWKMKLDDSSKDKKNHNFPWVCITLRQYFYHLWWYYGKVTTI